MKKEVIAEDFVFMARDGANTIISLTGDGELMRGDQRLDDLPPEELRQIIKKLVDLLLNMHNPNALSEMYKLRKQDD